MVRKEHKFLCLVLCLALILTTVFTGAVSVFAATGEETELAGASASGDVVYCKPKSGWSEVYCYMWNGGNGETKNANWPGEKMTKSGDEFVYNITGSYEKIIFNNNAGDQTKDLTYPGNNMVCDASTEGWSSHSGPAPTQSPTTATTPDPGNGTLVYFKNTANWDSPKCYMWTDGQGNNQQWPGASMTDMGEGVWMYQASRTFAKCIFNPGGDNGKTADLTVQNNMMYNYSTSQWEDPDTKDLRIKSFTADPSEDVYTGTQINLTAEASSKNGSTVSYRFTVKNAAGSESEIAGFSTVSSATWTPTQAGSYTLTLEVKDTAGNENSKSLSINVQSDAGLTKPVIKTVTPANLNLVKRNANTTIAVGAGGGQTGTNLLFYKYVVSDPNGVENTPYYTLNSTYDYVFTKLGTYTVNVFVQASDNSTASRTYTYTVTNNLPDPTVRPTTPVPTVAPTTAKPTTPSPTVAPTTAKPTTPRPTDPDITVSPTTNPSGYQKGDANRDHYVDIKDATYIQMHVAEYAEARSIDVNLADMNGDGKITVVDATALQFYIAS